MYLQQWMLQAMSAVTFEEAWLEFEGLGSQLLAIVSFFDWVFGLGLKAFQRLASPMSTLFWVSTKYVVWQIERHTSLSWKLPAELDESRFVCSKLLLLGLGC
jgi:hypothetical protein